MKIRNRIKKLVHHNTFPQIVSLMIILCTVAISIETMLPAKEIYLVKILDRFFILFFTIEIVLRIIASDKWFEFFKLFEIRHKEFKKVNFIEQGFWNWFDFCIAALGIVSLIFDLFSHPEFLVSCRIFRVLRVLRLLDVSESLKAVERKIVSIIPTIFSFGLLLAILLYIYSLVGIYLFGQTNFGKADFSSISAAFITLFKVMTLDNWAESMDAVATKTAYPQLATIYFLSFVVLTAIVSFNVFVAVLTSQVYEKLTEQSNKNTNTSNPKIEFKQKDTE